MADAQKKKKKEKVQMPLGLERTCFDGEKAHPLALLFQKTYEKQDESWQCDEDCIVRRFFAFKLAN